ncbi:hypothetical protein LLEC1_06724 [Akanthomyces lecanii]|uniref:Uncharacterized protein n=1 Tax=Cordyceps confragosa TaxID=2714763 RepID=A0A179IV66_CORDF|nr:hypothetical protein LLEC1_06724 [Akanthomyces lecanii]
MDHATKLTELDPMPIWTPVPSEHDVRRSRSPAPYTGSFDGNPPEGMALRLGPEGLIPDHPGSVADFGRPVSQPVPPQQTLAPPPEGPAGMMPAPYRKERGALDIRTLRQSCQYNLREYLAVQQEYLRCGGNAADSRVRHQTGMVLDDLMTLQMEVRELARAAQNHRWRKWLMGGIFASFIPLVRRIFRRGSNDDADAASNDTEYAFQKSKNILSRVTNSIFGVGKLASIGFFVFAVLYIFQNEVSLRVARTTQKRLKQLSDRVQEGDITLSERDMRVLEGWRWRVLLW